MVLFGDKSEILVNVKTGEETFHLSLDLYAFQQQQNQEFYSCLWNTKYLQFWFCF